MTTEFLLDWHVLLFLLPFGLGLTYLGLYVVSGWTFGDSDFHVDVDHDVDAHVDVDHDLSHDAEADADQPSVVMSLLGWFGVGRVPISLILMILLMSWGTVGFCVIAADTAKPIDRATMLAAVTAAIAALATTRIISSVLGKALDGSKNYTRRRHELLGSKAEAMYPIDETFGMVVGRDDRGQPFQVAARVETGQSPLAKGAAVQLVSYTASERMFYVVPAEVSGSLTR